MRKKKFFRENLIRLIITTASVSFLFAFLFSFETPTTSAAPLENGESVKVSITDPADPYTTANCSLFTGGHGQGQICYTLSSVIPAFSQTYIIGQANPTINWSTTLTI